MRISDWSSDVCSSDLVGLRRFRSALTVFGDLLPAAQLAWLQEEAKWALNALGSARDWDVFLADLLAPLEAARPGDRSEERRVGKECVSTCRSRGSPDH